MKNSILLNIVRFAGLFLAQVFIFNQMNIAGYINPLPYVLFLLVFPFGSNRSLYIFISFLTGLTIDMFGNSGGVHAAACLCLAYARPIVLRFAFGVSYEYNVVKLSKVTFYERFVYISLLVLLHHLVLFSLEVFNVQSILYILKKTLLTSIGTILLCLIINILFSGRQE